ncbi:hypothetical protein [Marinilactibacillus psychrotolerans]|uniref:hypothetical protein n=1 Tax=Marinilactibacillus psychrotolerans TaxID=191770 RepID=UPI00383AE03F
MRKITIQEKFRIWLDMNQLLVHSTILTFVGISFLVSDWGFSLFSFGELILIPLLPVVFLLAMDSFNKKDWTLLTSVGILVILHLSFQQFLNSELLIRPAIAASVKIAFFTTFIFSFFKYVIKFKLQRRFLIILNIIGIISIAIGAYIYIAIISEQLPFEFLWKFTRIDERSYFFRNTRYLVRMRSLFSEPAHFGFFLNTLLGINLLQNTRIKIPVILNGLLMISILFTFSFSSISIMVLVLFLYTIKIIFTNVKSVKFNLLQIIIIIVTIGLIIYFTWDFIAIAIIQRAEEIVTGQDNSALERIVGSWKYVNSNTIWLGNGFGNTPIIWNNFAYFLSDGGIVFFILSILGTFYIMYINLGLGIFFILMNFQRGGYLSPTFSLFLVVILLYASQWKIIENKLIRTNNLWRNSID